jgi:hypothetical protein
MTTTTQASHMRQVTTLRYAQADPRGPFVNIACFVTDAALHLVSIPSSRLQQLLQRSPSHLKSVASPVPH